MTEPSATVQEGSGSGPPQAEPDGAGPDRLSRERRGDFSEPPAVRDRRSLALSVVTLALIVGASAAFLLAQTLKVERSPLERPRVERVFSPVCGCESKATATLAFTVTSPVRVEARIVGANGRPVRTLARDLAWRPGRQTLQWDGRDRQGRIVPDGEYRWRVTLLEIDREIEVPTPVRVDTRPPRATLLSLRPRVVRRARGDGGTARPVAVRYRGSETGRPFLLVDGRSATRLAVRRAGTASISWHGLVRGRPVRAGERLVQIRLRDPAGNLGPPSAGARLRVLWPARR